MTRTIKLYSVSMMFCQDGARLLKASAESFVPSVLPPCGRVLLRRRRHLVAVVGNSFFSTGWWPLFCFIAYRSTTKAWECCDAISDLTFFKFPKLYHVAVLRPRSFAGHSRGR